ncbi:MAG: histidine triad nucleotide-binding protein [Oscillospiraceae bacterium]|nr:histidine triad nucleotide-binding protein [Oscillospiraceae bacterium]
MSNCLFCRIVSGEIPSTKVYEDEICLAFRDIAPMAPTHVLVIPKEHISGVSAVTAENAAIAGHCIAVCAKVAELEGLENGFRVVSNCGDDAGQTVPHLHFHVLGGRKLSLEMA